LQKILAWRLFFAFFLPGAGYDYLKLKIKNSDKKGGINNE